jgi:hypothetical protein
VTATLLHLERNTELLLKLLRHLNCRVTDEELRAIIAVRELTRAIGVQVPALHG